MHHWLRRVFVAVAPLLLTGCLWGPGKFTSDLTLRKDGSFVLDYRGEIVIAVPADDFKPRAWSDSDAHCFEKTLPPRPARPVGSPPPTSSAVVPVVVAPVPPPIIAPSKTHPCTAAEIAEQKADFERREADLAQTKRKQAEDMAKLFGLPGLDDESNRAFAAKLMKYAGWRSVTYRGHGVFDVDYHFAGRATQDFLFPALPDNDLLVPFIAIRRRADGSVLVTAPALVGGAGPLAARMGGLPEGSKTDMVSHAQGRFTVITDGEILTNNSEDGATANPVGRAVHWDVNSGSTKIPETLIRL